MSKRRLVILCIVLIFALACNRRSEPPVRHMSMRVKIIRPEAMVAKAEKPAAEKPEKKKAVKAKPPAEATGKPAAVTAGAEEGLAGLEEKELLYAKRPPLYTRTNRTDPFAPFLYAPEAKTEKTSTTRMRRVPRTPLERIALGQLKLTAIVKLPDRMIGLVQEASGKGYVIKVGTPIGERGGRVAAILKDRVIVEEEEIDVFGKKTVKKIEMKLKP